MNTLLTIFLLPSLRLNIVCKIFWALLLSFFDLPFTDFYRSGHGFLQFHLKRNSHFINGLNLQFRIKPELDKRLKDCSFLVKERYSLSFRYNAECRHHWHSTPNCSLQFSDESSFPHVSWRNHAVRYSHCLQNILEFFQLIFWHQIHTSNACWWGLVWACFLLCPPTYICIRRFFIYGSITKQDQLYFSTARIFYFTICPTSSYAKKRSSLTRTCVESFR